MGCWFLKKMFYFVTLLTTMSSFSKICFDELIQKKKAATSENFGTDFSAPLTEFKSNSKRCDLCNRGLLELYIRDISIQINT